ncbi:DUF502 domain-containing protein [Rubripirellula sp.]|jgi:uncharacterized membrane protein|nr:DUF502 domain-containing protein [Rubripirellula sp.]MDB4749547.1 DUF502 domain-containing protein [Rubripirellula sp.]
MSMKKSGGMNRVVRYFVAGLFAILPLLITVIAITWTLGFLGQLVGPDTFLGNQLSKIGLNFVTNPIVAYAIGWIGICIGTLVLGFLVESGMRGLFSKVTAAIARRLPLVGKVYDTSKQLVDMIDSGGDDKLKGMGVVYCTFGEEGGVGVLALLPTPEAITINQKQFYVVLVPQSPVPIGGGLLFMPVDAVERVNMSVESLMSIYVSMGVTAPGMIEQADLEKAKTILAAHQKSDADQLEAGETADSPDATK